MLERKPYAPPPTAEGAPALRDPYAAFRFRAYAFYALGNFIAITGRQMLTISIEWEVYARTHSATALGLVGLAAALPIVALSLPAGHLADRFRRKSIILWTQALSALCSISLALISWKHLDLPRLAILLRANDFLRAIATVFERHPTFHFDDLSLPLLYLVLLLSAAVRTFGWAARSSFFPTLVPRDNFANAVTWNSSIFQVSCVLGPALGGFLIVRLGFPFIYALDAVCALSFFFLVLPIEKVRVARRVAGNAWKQPGRGNSFCAEQENDSRHDHARSLRGPARRRDRTSADFCRSDFALRTDRARLAARRAGGRRVCHGSDDCLSAADAARRPRTSLVRERFRRGHDCLRRFALVLAFAPDVVPDWRLRQRERDRPPNARSIAHARRNAGPNLRREQYFHRHLE